MRAANGVERGPCRRVAERGLIPPLSGGPSISTVDCSVYSVCYLQSIDLSLYDMCTRPGGAQKGRSAGDARALFRCVPFFLSFRVENGAPKHLPALTPPLHVRWEKSDVSVHHEVDDCHANTPSPPQTPLQGSVYTASGLQASEAKVQLLRDCLGCTNARPCGFPVPFFPISALDALWQPRAACNTALLVLP